MKTINLCLLLVMALLVFNTNQAHGGLAAYGLCQAGCAGVAVACFAAAGFTFGTVPGAVIAATPALAACNTTYGACYALCAAAILAPTP